MECQPTYSCLDIVGIMLFAQGGKRPKADPQNQKQLNTGSAFNETSGSLDSAQEKDLHA